MPPNKSRTRSGLVYSDANTEKNLYGYFAQADSEGGRVWRQLLRVWFDVYERNTNQMAEDMSFDVEALRHRLSFCKTTGRWDRIAPVPPPKPTNKYEVYKAYNAIITEEGRFPSIFEIKSRLKSREITSTTTRIKDILQEEGIMARSSSKNANPTSPPQCKRRVKAAKEQLGGMLQNFEDDHGLYFYDQSSVNQEVLRDRSVFAPVGVRAYDPRKTMSRTPSVTLHYLMADDGTVIHHSFAVGDQKYEHVKAFLKAAWKKLPKEIKNATLVLDNLAHHHKAEKDDDLEWDFLFTPVQTPDANPIEHKFSEWKAFIRPLITSLSRSYGANQFMAFLEQWCLEFNEVAAPSDVYFNNSVDNLEEIIAAKGNLQLVALRRAGFDSILQCRVLMDDPRVNVSTIHMMDDSD